MKKSQLDTAHETLELLVAERKLKISWAMHSTEIMSPWRSQTWNHDTVLKFDLDRIGHCLVMNEADQKGKYNGMVALSNLRKAIAMLLSDEPLFEECAEYGCYCGDE
jgi:hypothetical protein